MDNNDLYLKHIDQNTKDIKHELHDIALGIKNLTDAITLFNNNYIALNQGQEMNSFVMDDQEEDE